MTLAFLLGAGKAFGAETDNPILQVKLTPESLPKNVTIAKEVWASAKQLLSARSKVGFPINALLSQSMIYENERAEMNYMLVPNEDWLGYGYSMLSHDAQRGFILTRGNVIVEVLATQKKLQDRLARLLKADAVHYVKVRAEALPQDWEIIQERYLPSNELSELVHTFGVPIQGAIVQEIMASHSNIEVRYYDCGTPQAAKTVANFLSSQERPFFTQIVSSSGPVVVKAESQSDELNSRIMSLVNW